MKTFEIYKVRYSWGEGGKIQNIHVLAINSVDAMIRLKVWAEEQFPVLNASTPIFVIEAKFVPCINSYQFIQK